MKRIIEMLMVAAVFALVGCTTAGVPQTAEQQVETWSRRVVKVGSLSDLILHPERRPAYVAADESLRVLVTQDKWDAKAFGDALATTGNKVFKDGRSKLLLGIVPELVDDLSGERLDLSKPIYLQAAIRGAADGLSEALVLSQ